jgi:cobalt-zinc-cadmium efflux system outer membrane protein
MERSKYMLRNISLILLFVLAIVSNVKAQDRRDVPPQVLALDSIMAIIERNNPMLQELEYMIRAKEAMAEGARAWMPPQVGAGLFMTPYRPNMAEGMNGTMGNGAFMISAEQMIPNPIKQRANQKYMEAQSAVNSAERQVIYNEIKAQVKMQLYEWLIAEKKLEVLRENEEQMRLMIKLAEIRYAYNKGNLGSVYKAQARLQEVENMQLMTNSEIDQRRIMINTMMKLPRDNQFSIDTTLNTAIELSADTAALRQTRSDIRKIDNQINVLQLNQALQSAQRYPDFGVSYSHMNAFGNAPNQFSLMGMITIPIAPWSSKMYKANVKGLKYEIQAYQKQREAILNEVDGMLQSMVSEIRAKEQQLGNYSKGILPALRKNYETSLLAYEQNTEELPMVIDAWEALNMAQMEYLNNLNQLLKMKVAYEKELEK